MTLYRKHFNPRTHEGCDSYQVTRYQRAAYFNPRTHEGCDMVVINFFAPLFLFQSTHPRRVRHFQLIFVGNMDISIHAPTKGATFYLFGFRCCCIGRFQSTHPRRVRPLFAMFVLILLYFNPRTHEGCDTGSPLTFVGGEISIHAPTKGATLFGKTGLKCVVFQSTHPRRVRHDNGVFGYQERYDFNPRTHEGCDRISQIFHNLP